jgi:hypothetical protein
MSRLFRYEQSFSCSFCVHVTLKTQKYGGNSNKDLAVSYSLFAQRLYLPFVNILLVSTIYVSLGCSIYPAYFLLLQAYFFESQYTHCILLHNLACGWQRDYHVTATPSN